MLTALLLGLVAIIVAGTYGTVLASAEDILTHRGDNYELEIHFENNTEHRRVYTFGLPQWHVHTENNTFVPFEWRNNVLYTGDYLASFDRATCSVNYAYPDKSTISEQVRLFYTVPKSDVHTPENCEITFEDETRTVKMDDGTLEWTFELLPSNTLKSTYRITNNQDDSVVVNPEVKLTTSGIIKYRRRRSSFRRVHCTGLESKFRIPNWRLRL